MMDYDSSEESYARYPDQTPPMPTTSDETTPSGPEQIDLQHVPEFEILDPTATTPGGSIPEPSKPRIPLPRAVWAHVAPVCAGCLPVVEELKRQENDLHERWEAAETALAAERRRAEAAEKRVAELDVLGRIAYEELDEIKAGWLQDQEAHAEAIAVAEARLTRIEAETREACAKIVDLEHEDPGDGPDAALTRAAAAIRAGGKTGEGGK